ncbi:MAG: hypothetical protein IPM53_30870 [Anaerolineaceae bacterium]|nr:hypothetical protein [Anaerolineaceae bacterium]
MTDRKMPKLLFPMMMAILVILLTVWGFYALSTGDPLWFQPVPERTYAPERITIHYYGESTMLESGDEAFRELSAALNQSLNDFRGRVSIGLSEVTLQDYRQKEYVLEVQFSDDVGATVGLNMALNHFLIPVDGRHSGNGYLFVGNNEEWLASALIIAAPQPLFTTLENLGYIPKN